MADLKLSALTELPSDPLATDWMYVVRGDGASPEGFTSYKSNFKVPYDVPLSFAGTPGAGDLMGKVTAVRDIEFAANFSGSVGHVGTNPGATFAIDVQDDGVSIGTISVATGGTFTFTTTSGTAKTVASGSRLEFYAPSDSPAEATVADIAATLKGVA